MAVKRVENFGKPKFKLSEPVSSQIYDFFEDYFPAEIERRMRDLNQTYPLKGLKVEIGRCEITKGQWLLYTTVCLNGQITNGGLVQFFENCPGLVKDALALLQEWADPEFAAAYEKAAKPLLGLIEKHAKKYPDAQGVDLTVFWEEFEIALDSIADEDVSAIETSCYSFDRETNNKNWFNAQDIKVLTFVKENPKDFAKIQ
ncbi:MAG: DUF4375 domain-containing protein [Rhodobacteraceae bacterium]|nr:DUF4375 domain-containing protein [Paracoccaceae bacterium]